MRRVVAAQQRGGGHSAKITRLLSSSSPMSPIVSAHRSFYDKLKERYQHSTVDGFEPGEAEHVPYKKPVTEDDETGAEATNDAKSKKAKAEDFHVPDEMKGSSPDHLASLDKETKECAEWIGNAALPVFAGLALFIFLYWLRDVWGDGRSMIAERNHVDWKKFADYSEPEIGAPPTGPIRASVRPRSY